MASTDPPETRYRITVRILVVAASVLAFLAIFTGWVDRQALDTNEWVDTSGKLLEDPAISDAVANYSVDQLYANVDSPGSRASALAGAVDPGRRAGLPVPASADALEPGESRRP